MANDRIFLVNTETGEGLLLAKHLWVGWYKGPTPEKYSRFFDNLNNEVPYLYSESDPRPKWEYDKYNEEYGAWFFKKVTLPPKFTKELYAEIYEDLITERAKEIGVTFDQMLDVMLEEGNK